MFRLGFRICRQDDQFVMLIAKSSGCTMIPWLPRGGKLDAGELELAQPVGAPAALAKGSTIPA